MGPLVALGILLLLGALPLGVELKYGDGGPLVKLALGPIRYTLLPKKKKPEKKTPPKKEKSPKKAPPKPEDNLPKPPQPPKPETPPEKPKEKGGSVTDFLPLVQVGLNLLGDFRRKLRVNLLVLRVTLAGDDPCDLAVNYGRSWAALGNLMPRLERWFVIKKRDLEVQCDFCSQETTIFAHMRLTITLGRLLSLAVVYGIRALKTYLNIQKKRKGGAVT